MSNAEQPFYRRPLWIVVAIFLAVVLVGGGIAAVTGAFSGGDETTAEPTRAPSKTSGVPDGAASACGLKDYETSNTLDAAPEAKWELVGTVAAPTDAKGAGPGSTSSDGVRSCYSHTAEGALYAIVNYYAQATDARLVPHIADLVAPGKGKDAALKNAAGDSAGGSATRLQVAGFKVNNYSASEATIDVVWTVTSEDNTLVSMPMVMRWVDGDWKVEVTESGDFPFTASAVDSLGGYIPWTAGV
ncbi:hypothetical protein [Curtobacterium sp. MCBD17_021]|uniref:hypothetical protein n=1 Tax=Curtobacterium sp. MCBD17_021 TaxID=2175665 RepID=UPI000DA72718|nr:hypothetical protein [Curtobacterium sp. MCBD17_021]PZE63629.1 hypothetical protein DEI83_13805 [Curtobacterium sp. MCBD17_021]